MIAYVTVGADDISRAKLFYSSFLPELGYVLREENNGDLSYVLPVKPSLVTTLPDFYVKKPFDGQPASTGNGSMATFGILKETKLRYFLMIQMI